MKFYEVVLSSRHSIEIDEEDYKKLELNLSSGNLIRVKQGIINPSFVVAILPIYKEKNIEVRGYIDEKTGKFIATTHKEKTPLLEDEFPRGGGVKKLGGLLGGK